MNLDSSPVPQRNSRTNFKQRFHYFIEDYWDIFLGIIAALFAYTFHTHGGFVAAAIASSMAIIFFSVTVSEIAEILADKLQEPYGSFVLTFSAVAVEILLLFMVLMETSDGFSTILYCFRLYEIQVL